VSKKTLALKHKTLSQRHVCLCSSQVTARPIQVVAIAVERRDADVTSVAEQATDPPRAMIVVNREVAHFARMSCALLAFTNGASVTLEGEDK
jgi:hypothetical protein